MAHVVLNFNAFLEKTKLKDDGSNYTDWVRNLRIILIAARKQYVLHQDIMNAWQSRADDYSLVQCGMLYSLEPGLQKRIERHGAYEIFEELKMVFSRSCPGREKSKRKEDGSNYSDWFRNLRLTLIAAKKDYVLDAPLGEAPIPENQDVMTLGNHVLMITPSYNAACFTA